MKTHKETNVESSISDPRLKHGLSLKTRINVPAASMRGYRDMCQRLVAEGADVDCRDNQGWTRVAGSVLR